MRLDAHAARDAIGAMTSVGPTTADEPLRATSMAVSVLGSCWAKMAAGTRRKMPLVKGSMPLRGAGTPLRACNQAQSGEDDGT